jgi:hypothetical protein
MMLLGHIMGIPVEESLLPLAGGGAGATLVMTGIVRLWLQRLRTKG